MTNKIINFKNHPTYRGQKRLFESIKKTPNFALRLREVKRNGWKIKKEDTMEEIVKGAMDLKKLGPEDVVPNLKQKGVDMRIGLDSASIAYKRLADIVIVITNDQDFVPAFKLARKEGLIVGLDNLGQKLPSLLQEHTDFNKTYFNKKTFF